MAERTSGQVSGRPRWLAVLVLVWAALLAASHLLRRLDAGSPAPGPAQTALELPALDRASLRPGLQQLAYRDEGEDAAGGAPVLLLHGSPGSQHDFDAVLPALSQRFRVIVPDLPGFGASTLCVPDYSHSAHAEAALLLLDALGVAQVHVVGFSMGGGVALQMAARAPDRVRSLTLLAGLGVQELELTGDHALNHRLHGLQLAALWSLRELVPHFGALDGAFFGVPYARNFYDSDQRPLRGILAGYDGPARVLHGRTDFLVPVQAAEEHHRILPQSDLVLLERGHFFVFGGGAWIEEHLVSFLDAVERGEAPVRAGAPTLRVERARPPYAPERFLASGLRSGRSLLLGIATAFSQDEVPLRAGMLVARREIGFVAAAAGCAAGMLAGSGLLLLAGGILRALAAAFGLRTPGPGLPLRRAGPGLVLLRLVPGLWLPAALAAGFLRIRLVPFLGWTAVGCALAAPTLVACGAHLAS